MNPTTLEKRRFYRHPVSVPIQYREMRSPKADRSSSVDLSEGGICFLSNHFLAHGVVVDLKIPVGDQLFDIKGQVVYCNRVPSLDRFRVGIVFQDSSTAFRAKLVEQMLLIREYRQKLSEKRGREIPEDQAAREWIERYAKHFSNLF